MADAIDRAVRAQGGFCVRRHQVQALVLAARRAYAVQARAGLVDDGVGFDAWRRAALHDVVGAGAPDSFKAVTQRDYAAALAYFTKLGGGAGPDLRTLTGNDERRRALWALAVEERMQADAFGGREGARRYADALLARIHRTDRAGATARQVWAALFTLRNRASGIRPKTAPGARGAEGVHSAPPEGSARFPAFSRGFPCIPAGREG